MSAPALPLRAERTRENLRGGVLASGLPRTQRNDLRGDRRGRSSSHGRGRPLPSFLPRPPPCFSLTFPHKVRSCSLRLSLSIDASLRLPHVRQSMSISVPCPILTRLSLPPSLPPPVYSLRRTGADCAAAGPRSRGPAPDLPRRATSPLALQSVRDSPPINRSAHVLPRAVPSLFSIRPVHPPSHPSMHLSIQCT